MNWICCIFLKNVYLEAAPLLWLVLIDHLHPWEEIAFLRTWSFSLRLAIISPAHTYSRQCLPQNVLFSNTHDFIILHATDFLFQICQFIFNASTNIPYWFWWFSLLAWKLLTIYLHELQLCLKNAFMKRPVIVEVEVEDHEFENPIFQKLFYRLKITFLHILSESSW